MTDEEKTAIFAYIDSADAHRAIVELETLLTAHRALAPENGGEGEAAKCNALLEWMGRQGLIDDHDDRSLSECEHSEHLYRNDHSAAHCTVEHYDAPDSRVPGGLRPNVAVTMPGTDDTVGAVWVISHLDVVPPGDLGAWHTDPWQVVEKDGALYGRGVEDDQQGIVSGVLALMAFVKCNVRPRHTVKLLFVSDEEVGSKYGMRYLMESQVDKKRTSCNALFDAHDLIIIPDGGDPKGETIEVAEKGILWLELTVTGQQAHGSRPDMGKNACLAACDLALRLHSMEQTFCAHDALFTPDYSTFSPTMRQSNVDSVNIIPGADTFCMDCRVLPRYDLDEVMAEVQKHCGNIEEKYGVSVKVSVLQRASSPATPADAPVAASLANALKVSRGVEAKAIGIGGGTVAAELRAKGFDAAVWGTIEDNAHQMNERALIANIAADAKTLAAIFD